MSKETCSLADLRCSNATTRNFKADHLLADDRGKMNLHDAWCTGMATKPRLGIISRYRVDLDRRLSCSAVGAGHRRASNMDRTIPSTTALKTMRADLLA